VATDLRFEWALLFHQPKKILVPGFEIVETKEVPTPWIFEAQLIATAIDAPLSRPKYEKALKELDDVDWFEAEKNDKEAWLAISNRSYESLTIFDLLARKWNRAGLAKGTERKQNAKSGSDAPSQPTSAQ
jgi:hypothetical protein